jgi:DNA-binding GntR family transcriptional regulator
MDDHELMLRLIARGDAEAAAREAGRHLNWVPEYHAPGVRRSPT